jgi:hypothetical protein
MRVGRCGPGSSSMVGRVRVGGAGRVGGRRILVAGRLWCASLDSCNGVQYLVGMASISRDDAAGVTTDAIRVVTNHVPRDVIDASELTADERLEFDYLDWEALEDGRDSASFLRYKGELYDLGEFRSSIIPGWDGYRPDSFFSGLVVRYCDDFERVVVGRYFA